MRLIKYTHGLMLILVAHLGFGAIAYFDPNTTAMEVFHSAYIATISFTMVYLFAGEKVKDNG